MDIITRDFINKNITYYDLQNYNNYSIVELCKEINFFKNLLDHDGNSLGKSIVIGIQPGIEQTACIFACFELGIKICIIDYNRSDQFKQFDYMDPKTELLLPIDFFIVSNSEGTDKFNYFSKICNKTIIVDQVDNKNYSQNKNIYSNPDTVIMKCTSSGTTDTPKIIEHSHRFLYNLSQRNAKFFNGKVGITHNLNHGSSFATYFLPALCSLNVKDIYNGFQNFSDKYNLMFLSVVDHLMLPYKHYIIQFLESGFATNKTIYTLSSISEEMVNAYKQGQLKDVISIFGSNETSGPTLINKASANNFKSEIYYKVDNFYKLDFVNGEMIVTLPYYDNRVINTEDRFLTEDDWSYEFIGRNSLKKINGAPVKEHAYSNVVEQSGLKESRLVYDIFENKIYLAISQENINVQSSISFIKQQIENLSNSNHTVDKFSVLDLNEFMSGVKLDQELLRHYFRKYVE